MEDIDNLIKEISFISSVFPFIRRIEIIDKTDNTIKAHLVINESLYIQFYTCLKTKTTNFSLLLENHRIFGRDSVGGKWHRHPYGQPLKHDFTKEGSRKVGMKDFLTEVEEILVKDGLI